jgi:glutaredoxin 3
MAKIEVYTGSYCPYCTRAKELLKKKGAAFTEIDVTSDEAGRATMMERSHGRRTIPQIFINDQHIGGCDDLYALDAKGGLDGLLA